MTSRGGRRSTTSHYTSNTLGRRSMPSRECSAESGPGKGIAQSCHWQCSHRDTTGRSGRHATEFDQRALSGATWGLYREVREFGRAVDPFFKTTAIDHSAIRSRRNRAWIRESSPTRPRLCACVTDWITPARRRRPLGHPDRAQLVAKQYSRPAPPVGASCSRPQPCDGWIWFQELTPGLRPMRSA